jgi:antitoxin HicB
MKFSYPYKIRKTGNEYIVSFPDVPEALTGASSRKEADALAKDALITALRGYIEDKKAIPAPSGGKKDLVHLSPLEAAKLGLYAAMREKKVSNVELGKRLNMAEGAVRRMLDLDHATKIETIYDALKNVFHYQLITNMERAA